MLNALIVVYRESFEALLIVGLLYAFLVKKRADSRGFQALAWGAFVGIVLSVILAFCIHTVESELSGKALEIFQLAMIALAVVLMTHMCIWMRKHGRTLKFELETGAQEALTTGRFMSLVTLTAIAVGREGSETVIFLYGMFFEAVEKSQVLSFVGMAIAGLALGVATWFIFQKGFQFFSQKAYFTFSSILLFITAAGLLMSVTRKMIELEWITFGVEEVWDTSALLSEQSWLGSLMSIVTGYHSRPAIVSIVAYFLYWAVVAILFVRAGQVTSQMQPTVVRH